MKKRLQMVYRHLSRNERSLDGRRSVGKRINLEYWDKTENIGDALAPVIYEWITDRYNLDRDAVFKHTKHLLTVGSVLGMNDFDSTVWGSGLHSMSSAKYLYKVSQYRKLDIRIVRGPVTQMFLELAGYDCPKVYGDPAVLMPLIYLPPKIEKKYKISVIPHISDFSERHEYHIIDVRSTDYKRIIDEIVSSEMVVSTSLHGLILAESYGIPAVFYNKNMQNEIYKYFDWYYSTNRYNVIIAGSVDEALKVTPMPQPDICKLQNNLLNTFPKDLWK